jgi:hypothetical protein
MTPEQEAELKRLSDLMSEKRHNHLYLEQQVSSEGGSVDAELQVMYEKSKLDLQEAANNFNQFTEILPLKQSS